MVSPLRPVQVVPDVRRIKTHGKLHVSRILETSKCSNKLSWRRRVIETLVPRKQAMPRANRHFFHGHVWHIDYKWRSQFQSFQSFNRCAPFKPSLIPLRKFKEPALSLSKGSKVQGKQDNVQAACPALAEGIPPDLVRGPFKTFQIRSALQT